MRPARLERATFWFVAKRSIQLSYGREELLSFLQISQLANRFDLVSIVWFCQPTRYKERTEMIKAGEALCKICLINF
jgi:hypothetical protein